LQISLSFASYAKRRRIEPFMEIKIIHEPMRVFQEEKH
jgi:hypothetical protein